MPRAAAGLTRRVPRSGQGGRGPCGPLALPRRGRCHNDDLVRNRPKRRTAMHAEVGDEVVVRGATLLTRTGRARSPRSTVRAAPRLTLSGGRTGTRACSSHPPMPSSSTTPYSRTRADQSRDSGPAGSVGRPAGRHRRFAVGFLGASAVGLVTDGPMSPGARRAVWMLRRRVRWPPPGSGQAGAALPCQAPGSWCCWVGPLGRATPTGWRHRAGCCGCGRCSTRQTRNFTS